MKTTQRHLALLVTLFTLVSFSETKALADNALPSVPQQKVRAKVKAYRANQARDSSRRPANSASGAALAGSDINAFNNQNSTGQRPGLLDKSKVKN